MRTLDVITSILLIIGSLNMGLIGFFGFNLLGAIFGEGSAFYHVVFALVGLSGLYEIGSLTFGFKATQERWCHLHEMAEAKH